MKIQELQQAVVDALNGVEELIQGGCKAFAENSRTVYDESSSWTQQGKVALVVVTPDMQRNGSNTTVQAGEQAEQGEGSESASSAIPAETQLLVQCSEKPAVARTKTGVITALDAAEIVRHALDGSQFCWLSTRQTIDRQAGVLTATVTFATTIHLS